MLKNLGFNLINKEISEYEKIKNIFLKPIFSIKNKHTFIIDSDTFINLDLKIYWGQRNKDNEHINIISQGIRNSNCLFHPFILFNNIKKEEYTISDGQHRYEALKLLSSTERKNIKIQVDIIDYNEDDEKWLLTQYVWINTTKTISKEKLDNENLVNEIVEYCSNYFGKIGGGHYLIGEFIEKNKNSSRLIKSSLRKELVLIIENNNDNNKILGNNKDEICKKIINYNELCNQNYNEKFKYTRIGKNVLQDCIKRKFWLGINFPFWLKEVFKA